MSATGTNNRASVPLRTEVERLNDALRVMRRATTEPQTDRYVEGLCRRIGEGRVLLAEHVVVLIADAVQRGAPACDVEAFARAVLAFTQRQCGVATAVGDEEIDRLQAEETLAQAEADVAQMALAHDKSPAALDRAARALARHAEVLHRLKESVLAKYHGTNGNITTERAA